MKKFTKNNSSFVCKNCNTTVETHPSSSRDHCNNCLYSLHIDINPGDRENDCLGLLKPIGLEIKSGKTKILYICEKCGEKHKNVTAPDDNQDQIIRLSSIPVFEV